MIHEDGCQTARGHIDDTQNPQGGARVRFPPPLVFLGGIVFGLLIGVVQPLPAPLGVVPRLACSVVLGLLGVALILSASQLFSQTGQDPKPWMPSPELILRGPYRFTRNPMYLGMTLLQSALGVGCDNLWAILLSPVALLIVHHIAVLPEERYLRARFGRAI
jgi:protein-S-isoprenylcysteine O-methyltransferase Ste14